MINVRSRRSCKLCCQCKIFGLSKTVLVSDRRRSSPKPLFLHDHLRQQRFNIFKRTPSALFILLFMTSHFHCANAQLLSAYEQAFGKWDIKLSRNIFSSSNRWYLDTVDSNNLDVPSNGLESGTQTKRNNSKKSSESDLQLLFPRAPSPQPKQQDGVENNDSESSSSLSNIANVPSPPTPAQCSTKSVRSVRCILTIEKNGKFSIHLANEKSSNKSHSNSGSTNTKNSRNTIDSIGSDMDSNIDIINQLYLPLQGEWYLTPNPYCVTDRQFDTLTLYSKPRLRIRTSRETGVTVATDQATSEPTVESTIEKATVELRCKLWGRYGGGSIRKIMGWDHGRDRGRMTHGTIMIMRECVDDSGHAKGKGVRGTTALPKREIVGVFRGRAIVDEKILESSVGGGDQANGSEVEREMGATLGNGNKSESRNEDRSFEENFDYDDGFDYFDDEF